MEASASANKAVSSKKTSDYAKENAKLTNKVLRQQLANEKLRNKLLHKKLARCPRNKL